MLRVADKIILLSILLSIFSAVKIIASCVSKPLEITSFARFPKGTRALRLGTFPDQFPTVENAVFNPMVISNKGNPNNLIAVCSQGDNYGVGFLADLVLYSLDAGVTWNQSKLITGRAQGATLPAAPDDFISPTDPYVTSDTHGNVHFIYAAIQSVFPDGSFNPGNAVNYTKSTDFGRSWNTLASIEDQLSALPKYFVDRPTITSNPFKPNVLYAVWGNVLGILIDPTTLSQTFELQISHDSGNTWSHRAPSQPCNQEYLVRMLFCRYSRFHRSDHLSGKQSLYGNI